MAQPAPAPLTAEDARPRLQAAREALLKLHRVLLDSERRTYERAHGRIESPGQLLELVMRDAWFVWLRALSAAIVHIDELLESEDAVVAANAASLLGEAQKLVVPSADDPAYGQHYLEALQRDPDVIVTHREAVLALKH